MRKDRNLNLILALSAGLLGSFVSRYVALPSVHAQMKPSNPVEIRAQRFSIVDDQGRVMGTFTTAGSEKPGTAARPRIALFDPSGREIWSAGTSLKLLTENPK